MSRSFDVIARNRESNSSDNKEKDRQKLPVYIQRDKVLKNIGHDTTKY
jgi:hypothetical protein